MMNETFLTHSTCVAWAHGSCAWCNNSVLYDSDFKFAGHSSKHNLIVTTVFRPKRITIAKKIQGKVTSHCESEYSTHTCYNVRAILMVLLFLTEHLLLPKTGNIKMKYGT